MNVWFFLGIQIKKKKRPKKVLDQSMEKKDEKIMQMSQL